MFYRNDPPCNKVGNQHRQYPCDEAYQDDTESDESRINVEHLPEPAAKSRYFLISERAIKLRHLKSSEMTMMADPKVYDGKGIGKLQPVYLRARKMMHRIKSRGKDFRAAQSFSRRERYFFNFPSTTAASMSGSTGFVR